jgi:hypothetical protein
MTIKYTEKVSALGWEYIERDNADGTISVIPIDEANSDYQAYLEHEAETK